MNYNLTTAFITIATDILLMCFVKRNRNIAQQARKGFIIAFFIVILGVVLHFLSLAVSTFIYKKILLLLKYSIIPLAPAIFAQLVFEKGKISSMNSKVLRVYFVIYELTLFIVVLFINKIHFLLPEIYAITFLVSALYLFIKAFIFSKLYQNTNKSELVLIICFLAIGVIIQCFNSKLQVSWLTISIASTFMYLYYNELSQSIDGLTSLLNQNRFTNDWHNLNQKAIIIVLDVNDFKQVNDTYGHQKGDEILCVLATLVKSNYEKYGKVYRMGGDEFSVILTKNIDKFEVLNKNLIDKIQEFKEVQPELPHISYGCALYEPSSDKTKHEVLQEADAEMYKFKNLLKSKK